MTVAIDGGAATGRLQLAVADDYITVTSLQDPLTLRPVRRVTREDFTAITRLVVALKHAAAQRASYSRYYLFLVEMWLRRNKTRVWPGVEQDAQLSIHVNRDFTVRKATLRAPRAEQLAEGFGVIADAIREVDPGAGGVDIWDMNVQRRIFYYGREPGERHARFATHVMHPRERDGVGRRELGAGVGGRSSPGCDGNLREWGTSQARAGRRARAPMEPQLGAELSLTESRGPTTAASHNCIYR